MHNPLEGLVQNTLDVIGRLNGKNAAVTQAQYGTAMLQRVPGQVTPLDAPNSDIFGGRFTYHRYADPQDQQAIKGFETTIGNLKNTMPLLAGGAFLAGQLLSPVRKMLSFIPGASILLNPLTLAGGAGLLSSMQIMSKREEMNNFLSGRMKQIQGNGGDFERDLSAMSMGTMNQETGLRAVLVS